MYAVCAIQVADEELITLVGIGAVGCYRIDSGVCDLRTRGSAIGNGSLMSVDSESMILGALNPWRRGDLDRSSGLFE